MSLSVFYDGSVVRVLSATYLGETGKLMLRYYLVDSINFVVDREDVTYAGPLSGGAVTVRSRVRDFAYFCGGKRIDQGSVDRLSDVKPTLDTLLLSLHRKP